jgi:membrane protease YdiL (CAAX protease family)
MQISRSASDADRPSDYGYKWRFMITGVLAFVGWMVTTTVANYVSTALPEATPYRTTAIHGAGLAWLTVMLAFTLMGSRSRLGDLTVRGSSTAWLIGLVAVAAAYGVKHAWSVFHGVPQEPFMATLYLGKSTLQVFVFLVTAVTIVPLAEELAFRHFLLGSLPYRRSKFWAATSAFGTALVFAAGHMPQYQYHSTEAFILLLGFMFAAARIATGGLVLPVVLHAEAAAIGLLLNELR